MKKIFTIAAILCMGFASMGFDEAPDTSLSKADIVYICTGPKAKVYHRSKHCGGLNNCSGTVKAVRLSEVSGHRRPCRKCVK